MSEENQIQSVIHLCVHCGTQCGGKYCPQCSTAAGRREQDEANRKNFEENGLPPYHCEICEAEDALKEEKK